MEHPTTLEAPIVFYHMHAGCVKPFDDALYDALECPEVSKGYSYVVIVYGMAQTQSGEMVDLREGRRLIGSGSYAERPPYWQSVCLVEGDLSTHELVCPAGDDPYWEKVAFTPLHGKGGQAT